MMKKIILGLISVSIFLCFNVNAATCDYSEQVELNNIASSIKVNYETKKEIINGVTGEVVPGVTEEDVSFENDYEFQTKIILSILNITDKVYLRVTGSDGMEKDIPFSETTNGLYEFSRKDLTKIIDYKIKIYSNSSTCKDTELRTIEITTPMYNHFSSSQMCSILPDYSYCQEYIVAPFLKTDAEINDLIFETFFKKQESLKHELEAEKQTKSFWETIKDFVIKNKIWIISILTILVVIGVATTVWVIRKRRSRLV